MPLADWFALHYYGPHCVSAVGTTDASSAAAAAGGVVLTSDAVGSTTSSGASANLTDGRRGEAVGIATSSGVLATGGARLRGGAVGKVSELTQGDVVGAISNLPIEGGLTLPEVLRLLLCVAAGDATGLDGTPAFKSLDGSKTRVGGTISGPTRTITTRDAT